MKDSAEAEVECPIPFASLNQLNRADASDILGAVRDYPEEQRVRLALYCYNRAHLRKLGLTVAASLDPERLAQLGGTLGEVIAHQSRASGLSFGTEPSVEPKKRAEKPKPKISLGGRGWTDR